MNVASRAASRASVDRRVRNLDRVSMWAIEAIAWLREQELFVDELLSRVTSATEPTCTFECGEYRIADLYDNNDGAAMPPTTKIEYDCSWTVEWFGPYVQVTVRKGGYHIRKQNVTRTLPIEGTTAVELAAALQPLL